MKAMPIFCGVAFCLGAPLAISSLYSGTISVATAYVIVWSAVFFGGAWGGRAVEVDQFIPALITGLWAGGLTILFSPAQEDLWGALSTLAVFGFVAVLGARVLNRERR
ncbi:MAG: hypothetical protein FD169_1424 [Bacillota bacterium]|nr:MAG: hypothetical protein FD169_1424 [Bacillota bacterium]MBS3950396.1 hypothetical protein [Peptococcaceae bacterium]